MGDIERLLSMEGANGGPCWSRADGDIHAPAGFSTIDALLVLGELGAMPGDYPAVARAVEFVFGYFDGEGAFRYAPKSSKLPCLTARILAGLGQLGLAGDARAEACYARLLAEQREDGGWRCATAKLGKATETDASNPGTTLYALDAFRYRKNSAAEERALDRARDFLLAHWETRAPLGPCAFGIGTNFLKVEYPFLRYNLFYYVRVLAGAPRARKDPRFRAALAALRAKCAGGGPVLENPHRAWKDFDFARRGERSPLADRRWAEIAAVCLA